MKSLASMKKDPGEIVQAFSICSICADQRGFVAVPGGGLM
jgi:hypothetical protein